MPEYTVVIDSAPWSGDLQALLDKVKHVDALLDRIVDKDVLPTLLRHFDASGIKSHSGEGRAAVGIRHAKGNRISRFPGGVTVGLDMDAVPYMKWVIDGRGPVYAKGRKSLHWKDENGKDVFVKHVGAAPSHDIYYLTSSELGEIEADLNAMLAE